MPRRRSAGGAGAIPDLSLLAPAAPATCRPGGAALVAALTVRPVAQGRHPRPEVAAGVPREHELHPAVRLELLELVGGKHGRELRLPLLRGAVVVLLALFGGVERPVPVGVHRVPRELDREE